MPIHIRELTPAEMPSIYPLVRQLNPELKKPVFLRLMKQMQADNYHAIGAFDGKKLVGCSGFWLFTRFWCERQMDIDNFVVDKTYRGGGVGSAMVKWLEAKATKEKCSIIVLDAYATSAAAHQFYMKQGFAITGYHFTKMPGSKQIGTLPNNRRI